VVKKKHGRTFSAHGDTFYALHPSQALVNYSENRAMETLKIVDELMHKIKQARGQWKNEDKTLILYQKLLSAEEASKRL
jgi:hypothetical protein